MQTKDEKKIFFCLKNYTTPSVAKSTLDKADRTQNHKTKLGGIFFWEQRRYIVSKTFHFVCSKGKYRFNGREAVHALKSLIMFLSSFNAHNFIDSLME